MLAGTMLMPSLQRELVRGWGRAESPLFPLQGVFICLSFIIPLVMVDVVNLANPDSLRKLVSGNADGVSSITFSEVGRLAYSGWHHCMAGILGYRSGEGVLSSGEHSSSSLLPDGWWQATSGFKFLLPSLSYHGEWCAWTMSPNNPSLLEVSLSGRLIQKQDSRLRPQLTPPGASGGEFPGGKCVWFGLLSSGFRGFSPIGPRDRSLIFLECSLEILKVAHENS